MRTEMEIGPIYWQWLQIGELRADVRTLKKDVAMLQRKAERRNGLSSPWVRIAIMGVLVGMSLVDVVSKGEVLNALARALLRGL